MSSETDTQFHERRATEEHTLADRATESVEAIPHGQLSKLHADEALACGSALAPLEAALDVTAIGGVVVLAAPVGEITSLTPEAAAETGDLLLARSREAGRQKPRSHRHTAARDQSISIRGASDA